MIKRLLLIVDPQNDFVDPKGSLYIPGAEKAIEGICEYIKNESISEIAITQDTHHRLHIAHPAYWNPRPKEFTQITAEDYKACKYSAILYPPSSDRPYSKFIAEYLESLPGPLTIWPEHCIEGSWGWCFPKALVECIQDWELNHRPQTFAKIYQKGMIANFEAFSLFTPFVCDYRPYANIKVFTGFDEIVVCGFAKDICVAATVKDMIESGLYTGKIKLLESGLASIDPESPNNEIFKCLS